MNRLMKLHMARRRTAGRISLDYSGAESLNGDYDTSPVQQIKNAVAKAGFVGSGVNGIDAEQTVQPNDRDKAVLELIAQIEGLIKPSQKTAAYGDRK
jgi:hypothetical protein